MAQLQYCTSGDLNLVLSANGVTLRSDDNASAVSDAIDEASAEIDFYCARRYDPASALATSLWVAKKCRVIAAAMLCTRRANPIPQGISFRYEKAIKDLENIQSGKLQIPLVAGRKTDAPVLSNQRAALSPLPRVVTEMGRSTGTPQGYSQPQPAFDPYALYGDDWYI